MFKTVLRREFNLRALGFSHDRPQQFMRSQWQKTEGVSIVYLLYRWVFALFFLGVLIYSIATAVSESTPLDPMWAKWFVYLTHWGFIMCTVQAFLAAGLVTQRLMKERATGFIEDHSQMPRIYKFYWLLHTLSVVIAIGITGSYFIVEYNPALHKITALNLLVHAFNSILMVIDVIIVEHPFRLVHFVYSFSFIIFYFSFTVVYYLLGGTGKHVTPYIYPALYWKNVKQTLPVATLGAFSVILAHFCTWLIVLARRKIASAEEESSEELKISKMTSNKVQPFIEATP